MEVPYEQWEWSLEDEDEDLFENDMDWFPIELDELFLPLLILGRLLRIDVGVLPRLSSINTSILESQCKISTLRWKRLILGAYCSIALPLTLWELLLSPEKHPIKKYSLVFSGLFACLLVIGVNFNIFLALALREIDENSNTNENVDFLSSFLLIFDLEIDWELAESRKFMAFGILGYGSIMSVIFLVGCLVKYFGIPASWYFMIYSALFQDTL